MNMLPSATFKFYTTKNLFKNIFLVNVLNFNLKFVNLWFVASNWTFHIKIVHKISFARIF